MSSAKTKSKADGPARRNSKRGAKARKKADTPKRTRHAGAALRRLLLPLRRKWLFYPLVALLILVLSPLVLTLLYRFEPIRPVSNLMISHYLSGAPVDRQWVEIDDISPRLVQSVLMSEDGQFCSHHGLDLGELRGVISDALDGERPRGASTITMQTAKNLFLWNGRSFLRKGLEVPLAIWIDLVLPKHRIMEIYLNVAEWGPSSQFGIGAAAEHHFGRAANNLSNRQSALLAVTLPNPHIRDPARPSAHMNRVANIVQRRAAQSGAYIGCLPD